MAQRPTEEPIRQAVTVPVPPEWAFATFTELARWWPHSWAADTLEDIGIEPREGGFCFERGPYGFTCHWGRVLVWDPPARLRFAWQIAPGRVPEPNPAKASEVEVRFLPVDPTATRVEVQHRGFASHGEGGDAYRQALSTPEGWPLLLDRYAAVFI